MLQRLRKFVHLHHIWTHKYFLFFYPCHFIAPLSTFSFISPINRKKLQESLPEAYHLFRVLLFCFENYLIIMYQTQLFFRHVFYVFVCSDIFI